MHASLGSRLRVVACGICVVIGSGFLLVAQDARPEDIARPDSIDVQLIPLRDAQVENNRDQVDPAAVKLREGWLFDLKGDSAARQAQAAGRSWNGWPTTRTTRS